MPYLIFTLIIGLLVAVFAVQNAEMVVVDFLAWTYEVSLVVVILGAALAGALAMSFFTMMIKAKQYVYNKGQKYEIESLKKENSKYKAKIAMLMHSQRTAAATAVPPTEADSAMQPKETTGKV